MSEKSRTRGQNEGSIFKRKDGRWAAVVNFGYKDGRRQRKTFYGTTRKEVQDKLTQALRARQQNLPLPSERLTVKQFLTTWLQDCAKPALRPRTYENYCNHVNKHLIPALGHIRLAKLTAQEVQKLLNDKISAGLAPRTVHYMHAVLRRALNQAVRWDSLVRNVATLVDRPRAETKEIEPLSPDQARAFLKAVAGDRLEALYTVALAMGLRKGEALGLRWSVVDFDSRQLAVTASLQRIEGKLKLAETKTRQGCRTITVPENVIAALRIQRVRQMRERLAAGERWREHGLVFTTTIGTPIDPRNLSTYYKRHLARAGLPPKRFHDLRHTCASLLLAQGVHARVVMEILGHSQIGITMNTYSHVLPALQKEAASRMNALLEGTD